MRNQVQINVESILNKLPFACAVMCDVLLKQSYALRITTRVCLLVLLALARACYYVCEQPLSSAMVYYPYMTYVKQICELYIPHGWISLYGAQIGLPYNVCFCNAQSIHANKIMIVSDPSLLMCQFSFFRFSKYAINIDSDH